MRFTLKELQERPGILDHRVLYVTLTKPELFDPEEEDDEVQRYLGEFLACGEHVVERDRAFTGFSCPVEKGYVMRIKERARIVIEYETGIMRLYRVVTKRKRDQESPNILIGRISAGGYAIDHWAPPRPKKGADSPLENTSSAPPLTVLVDELPEDLFVPPPVVDEYFVPPAPCDVAPPPPNPQDLLVMLREAVRILQEAGYAPPPPTTECCSCCPSRF